MLFVEIKFQQRMPIALANYLTVFAGKRPVVGPVVQPHRPPLRRRTPARRVTDLKTEGAGPAATETQMPAVMRMSQTSFTATTRSLLVGYSLAP